MSILRTERLSRHFGGLAAVSDVSIEVQPGELRAIIGPNGAGKTTLFNLLTGRFAPSHGRVYIRDHDVTGWAPQKLVHIGVARTFQRTNIFPKLSARENVRVAAQTHRQSPTSLLQRRRAMRDVEELTDRTLATVGLVEQADRPAAQLAYGDQRLLEIGIALATQPRILMLDEPMAGMSPGETRRTAELIRSLAGSLSILLIEHDMDVVLNISDCITVMHFGKVIAEGSPAEVRANREVQQAYLGGAQ